jgi:glycosyltransferase involved in cell wall biosynthesis
MASFLPSHSSPPAAPPAESELDRQRRRRLALLPAALVHDWLLGMRGGEWVLTALLRLLPLARIYTLFYRPDRLDSSINMHAIQASGLNRLPGVGHYYRWLLPFLPGAAGRLRPAPDRRLVLAVSHCVAHGVPAPDGAVSINYCLSPMRYLYDQHGAYRGSGLLAGRGLGWFGPRLRLWDAEAAARADHVWAISRFVAGRIQQHWGRSARVIHPPVRTHCFTPPPPGAPARSREYLLVSAMVPYKRVDLAIRVANKLRLPLRVVGDGPLLGAMRRLAGHTVAFEGRVSQERLAELYRTRRGLIFPAEEDFGLVPPEAMACGMPVLGLRAGGLLETHVEESTGAFFDEPTVDSLAAAWSDFRPTTYDPASIRANAERFGEERFLTEVATALEEALF